MAELGLLCPTHSLGVPLSAQILGPWHQLATLLLSGLSYISSFLWTKGLRLRQSPNVWVRQTQWDGDEVREYTDLAAQNMTSSSPQERFLFSFCF